MAQISIRDNLSRIRERISAAAQRAGRNSGEVTLIGVSKTQPAEAIRAAYDAGVRHFGENRVQEWEGKRPELEDLSATWHLIGHLQSNKAARAAALFHSVDSVDSLEIAERLDRAGSQSGSGAKLRMLLEVRVGEEDTKSGVAIADVPAIAGRMAAFSYFWLAGLLCIPPFLEDTEKVRPHFRCLRQVRDDLQEKIGKRLPVLSMGMSHDFEVAIEEGATEVRIGTALFGARPAPRV